VRPPRANATANSPAMTAPSPADAVGAADGAASDAPSATVPRGLAASGSATGPRVGAAAPRGAAVAFVDVTAALDGAERR
jgi:hypothetical protein